MPLRWENGFKKNCLSIISTMGDTKEMCKGCKREKEPSALKTCAKCRVRKTGSLITRTKKRITKEG